MHYYVYIIESGKTDKWYVGYTKDYKLRWNSHIHTCRKGKKSRLYNCMRKHGAENFEMILVKVFNNKNEALEFEKSLISLDDDTCLNLVPGGEGGFVVQDKESWKQKLSKARKGKKPFLGMKHTEENKNKFSTFGSKRWDKYGRYPSEIVLRMSFIEANKLYGISKTHYYRLLKQAKSNDLG